MTDISCKFYLQDNDVTYTYCANLVEVISDTKSCFWHAEVFTGSYKKREGSGLTPKYTEHQKVKR